MNDDRRMGAADRARFTEADAAWLDAALHEALRGEAPPDLRLRVLRATPAQAAMAAEHVDAARVAPVLRPWWAAAIALFAALVVGGVFLLQRAGRSGDDALAVAQQPSAELAFADARQLAAWLARTTTVAVTALQGVDGARLPNEPEYGALLDDAVLLPALRMALGAEAATTAPFALHDAQAELRLAGEPGWLRLRLSITDDSVRVGAAQFAFAAPLPAGLAGPLRSRWQELARQKPPARQRMQVHTTRQLLAAIGSDRTIELVGGPFVLDPEDADGALPVSAAVEFGSRDPVPYVIVKGVHNLQLRAVGGPVRVLSRSPAEVVQFTGCRDVLLEGLVLGHTPSVEFHCVAPVLTLQQSNGFVLRDCELFGCGTEGVVAEQVDRFRMERGEIHTCRNGVAYFTRCKGVALHGVLVRDCGVAYRAFDFTDCDQVRFTDCIVRGLDAALGGGEAGDGALFGVTGDEAVAFVRGAIRGNRTRRVANSKLLLVRDGTDERDNGPAVELPPPPGR